MRTTKTIFFAVLTFVIGVSSASAQSTNLSKAEEESLKQAIKETVDQFNDRLTEIWRRPNQVERLDLDKFNRYKDTYIATTLQMFINNGNAWWAYDTVKLPLEGRFILDSVLIHEAPRMQTSSVNNSKSKSQLVKTYLRKAKNSSYRKVEVTSSESCFCSNLRKISDNAYEATLTFTQLFRAYNGEGRLVYGDRTTKTIKAYVFPTVTVGEIVWNIALGDIKVTETSRL